MNDNKFMLSSLLLVCDPNLPAKCTFFWLGTINSDNNKIELIAFRTDKKSEIQGMLENDLKTLKTFEQTPNVKQQIAFIENTLKTMSNSIFVKQPAKSILETAARGLKLNKLEDKDVIYLSWVCGVIK